MADIDLAPIEARDAAGSRWPAGQAAADRRALLAEVKRLRAALEGVRALADQDPWAVRTETNWTPRTFTVGQLRAALGYSLPTKPPSKDTP